MMKSLSCVQIVKAIQKILYASEDDPSVVAEAQAEMLAQHNQQVQQQPMQIGRAHV